MREPAKRLDPAYRQTSILEAAAHLAHGDGYQRITQSDISKAANVSHGLITHHFGSMENLRAQLMQWAIDNGDMRILAQGLATSHPIALAAPDTAKSNALSSLNNA